MFVLGALNSFNGKLNSVRMILNIGEKSHVSSHSVNQSSNKEGIAERSDVVDRGLSMKRKYLRRKLRPDDDRFDEVFELGVTHMPETKWPPTISPSKPGVQPQVQANSPTIEYSYSPPFSAASSMEHYNQPSTDDDRFDEVFELGVTHMPETKSPPTISPSKPGVQPQVHTNSPTIEYSYRPPFSAASSMEHYNQPSTDDDRFDEVFELGVTRIPEKTWPPTMSPSKPQPQEQTNSPTIEYSYSPPFSAASSMEHSTQPPSTVPNSQPVMSTTDTVVPTSTSSMSPSATDQPSTSKPSELLSVCPPAYNASIAVTYDDGSEVEAHGIIYRCNPYPFAIYCTMHSYRPDSSDNTSWKDAWEGVSACAMPNSMLIVWPSLTPSVSVSCNVVPWRAKEYRKSLEKLIHYLILTADLDTNKISFVETFKQTDRKGNFFSFMDAALTFTFADQSLLSIQTTPPSTLLPSISPSSRPSGRPTKMPTPYPTSFPSTSAPTLTLSESPSLSGQPSLMPSHHPSISTPPSNQSIQSTLTPTKNPSLKPSNRSTEKTTPPPTLLPSISPSSRPSGRPTKMPTPYPTSFPSTSAPTLTLSESPSLSGQPSLMLSHHPSISTPPSNQSIQSTLTPTKYPSLKPSNVSTEKTTPPPTLLPSISPSSRPSGRPTKMPTPYPPSIPSTSAPTLTLSESPSLLGQLSLMLSHHPSISTPPSNELSMSPVMTMAPSFRQSTTLRPTSSVPTTTSHTLIIQTFELSICPPAYDQMSLSSYSSGSTVEMNGFIYRCNPYPYEIYCTMPSFQPQSDNEFWVDAWAAVAPCIIDVSLTMKPSLKPSSKSSTSFTSDSFGGATYSPTTKSPIHSPTTNDRTNATNSVPSYHTYVPTYPSSQTATIYSPTISPKSIQPEKENMKTPTYSPMIYQNSTNHASNYQNSAAYSELEQSSGHTTQNGKTVLWTSLAVSAAVFFFFAAAMHRCFRSPERSIFFDFSKEEETCREIPGGSGSMSFQTDSGLPAAVLVSDARSKWQQDLYGRNFELLAPSSISRAQSKEPDKFKYQQDLFGRNYELLAPSSISRAQSKEPMKSHCQPDLFDRYSRLELLPPSSISRSQSNEPVPSRCVLSPMSMTCLAEASSNTKRDVIAPPGKPGIILKQSLHGCMIQSVKPESPLLGLLLPDDLILSFNDIDVLDYSAHRLMQLIAENIEREMKFTVICKRDLVKGRQAKLENANKNFFEPEHKPVPSQRTGDPQSSLPELSSNIKRTIIVPPGKLGIILKQTLLGCMIQSVKPGSPMLGILQPDDLILSFNDIDVLGLNVRQLTQLMAENINTKKKFTVVNKSGRSSSSSFSSSHNDDKYFIPCKATRTKLRNVQFTVPVDQ
ncbi:hypothetical protein ACHAXA_004387 [Cyclostephanos tholiformis]|uniref:PDZ domain-containing protein n=1 Tax=Cyclostephanos tholiformis TaxID=382380 RepID=A0ABD3RF31_9STRA